MPAGWFWKYIDDFELALIATDQEGECFIVWFLQTAQVVCVLVGVGLHNVYAICSVFGLAWQRASLLLIKDDYSDVSILVGASSVSHPWLWSSLACVIWVRRTLANHFNVRCEFLAWIQKALSPLVKLWCLGIARVVVILNRIIIRETFDLRLWFTEIGMSHAFVCTPLWRCDEIAHGSYIG